MNFKDLEFGWHSLSFSLNNVRILRRMELQEKDEDGNWIWRKPPWYIGIDMDMANGMDTDREKENKKYEAFGEIRYSISPRKLIAKASNKSKYCDHYLGIPEDRKSTFHDRESINEFEFSIIERSKESLEQAILLGSFGYIEPDSDIGNKGVPFIELSAPPEFFDAIEKLTKLSDLDFDVEVRRKGWYWYGPIGDKQVYWNTKSDDLAELGVLTVVNKLPESKSDVMEDAVTDEVEDEDYSERVLESNMDLLNKLSQLGTRLESLNAIGILILALVGLYIAYKL